MNTKRAILLVILYFLTYFYSQSSMAVEEEGAGDSVVVETPSTPELQTSSTPSVPQGTRAAIEAGHNDVSCEELPVGENVAQLDIAELVGSNGQLGNLSPNQSEHTWQPEWTEFAMECMDQHAQDILNPNTQIPEDYQEYCGAPIRQHVDAERRLFLLSVLIATAQYESGFNPEIVADLDAIQAAGGQIGATQTSENPPTGLFQMGIGDCIEGESCDLTDPRTSICMAVHKANQQITEDEVFAGCKNDAQTCKGDEWGGMAAYWEPHRTMTVNNAISKANAIKNAVRGVCGCTGRDSRSGGAFSNLPPEWIQAATGRAPAGGFMRAGGPYSTPSYGAQ